MFKLRSHQEKLAREVLADLRSGSPEVLLAACPGFGKTEVAMEIIGRLLRSRHIKNALVLAHGTTVLRSNFQDRLEARRPDLLPHVRVALPQDWRRLTQRFDLVVVDEAHQFYEAGQGSMVDRVLKQVKAKRRLLLTGSPARFIRRGLAPHAFALDELFQADGGKWVSDIQIDMALSAYDIHKWDWDERGEVRDRVRYRQGQTDETLGVLLSALGPRLDVGKAPTLIACKSIRMADQVADYLRRRKIRCDVSHSKTDNSESIEAFKLGATKVLVVVARATLGFDYPGMRNFVDLTGSRNPDRIFQMMCRLVRPSEGRPAKTFVKVMPKAFSGEHLRLFMTGVCALKHRELYTTWDGGSLYKLRVPVTRSGEPSMGDGGGKAKRRPAFEVAMMLFGDGFETVRDESGTFATARLGSLTAAGPRQPERNKAAILAFFQTHGRWPRRCQHKEESRLEMLMMSYVSKRRSDPAFERALKKLGWRRSRGGNPRMINIGGKLRSLSDWAKIAGIGRSAIYHRWKVGLRGDRLLAPTKSYSDVGGRGGAFVIEIEGVVRSASAWSRFAGLNAATVSRRFKSGIRGPDLLRRRRVRRGRPAPLASPGRGGPSAL